jgi:hypothetical protein
MGHFATFCGKLDPFFRPKFDTFPLRSIFWGIYPLTGAAYNVAKSSIRIFGTDKAFITGTADRSNEAFKGD